jgi:two-component system response regulator PhcR
MPPRLLIVDDEQDMLDFLERVFRREYEVARAQSVEEAVRIIGDGTPAFDVVITDRRMPRRNGLELLEVVSRKCPNAARVLLTGYAESLVNEKVSQWALVDAWVSKPIDSVALKQAIRDAIGRHAPVSGAKG